MKKLKFHLAAVFAVVVASTAFAGSDAWTGGGADNNWMTAGNWGGVVPAPGDFLYFGSGTFTPNNNFPADTAFGDLAFTNASSGFTVTGNEILLTSMANLGGGSVGGGSISNTTANAEAVNLPVVLGPGRHNITSTGGGVLTLGGTVTPDTGAAVFFNPTTPDTVNVTGSGLANDATGILGGWAIYGGTDYAALDGSGNVVAYTGYSVQSGNFTAVAGANVELSANNGGVLITPQDDGGTVADINSLVWAPSAANNETISNAPGNILRLGPVGGIFNTNAAKILTIGPTATTASTDFLTAGGADNTPGTIVFFNLDNPTTTAFNIDSSVTNNGTGAVTLVFAGGYVGLGLFNSPRVNTYSGGTYILAGRVTLNLTNSLGIGPAYIYPGGELFVQATPITNNLSIAGVGTTESGGLGAIRSGGARTFTGTVTLTGDASIGGGNNVSNIFSGQITGPGGLMIGSGTATGGRGIIYVGSASGANNYQGNTTIHLNTAGNDTLEITSGMNNVMPNGPSAGNVIINGNAFLGIFDLNGTAQTINGLISTGTVASAWVTNSTTATTATLTLGANNAAGNFGGIIGDHAGAALSVTKTGSGIQTLSGANTYTGNTTVSGGTLLVSGSLASGSAVSVGAGALGGTGTINGPVTTTSASAQINQETNYLATGNTVGTLTLASLDLSGGGVCDLDISTSHLTGNDKIVVNGALTLGSGTVFHLNALGGTANLDVADYVLVQAGSISGGTVNSTPVWDGATPANAASYVVRVSGNNVVLHNSTYTGPIINSDTATPSNVSRIQSALLSVTVTNGIAPYTVKIDASSIGGSSTLNLVRNTSTAPNIYIYTNSVTPSGSTTNGNYLLPVSATDTASQTANANISLTVIGASLVWSGDASGNSYWDISSVEWQGGLIYRDGDLVRFDDTAMGVDATNINLQTTLSPGSMVVSNTAGLPTGIYTFNGNNSISGGASLLKQGSGTLLMDEGSDNFTGGIVVGGGSLTVGNFYGTIAISGGLTVTNNSNVLLDQNAGIISGNLTIGASSSVQIGNNDQYGALPSGAVTMNGALIFDNSTAVPTLNVSNLISGASTGNLVQSNANAVVLFAQNTFVGNIAVYSGTLSNTVTAPNNGSTGGFGASTNAGRTITVAPGATLGGGKNNWFGNNTVADANLPSIIVNGGTVYSSRYTTIGNVTLNNGATLSQASTDPTNYQGYQFRGTITVGGPLPSSISGVSTNNDDLGSNTVFNVAVTSGSGPDLFVAAGLRNQSQDFASAAGGFTKTGAGTMELLSNNTYTGNTTISAGTLALNGSGSISNTATIIVAGGATLDATGLASPTFVLGANQTLSNSTSTAVLSGNFDVSAGTNSLTYTPGTPSFTVENGTLTLASTSVFKINNVGAAWTTNSYKIISKGAGGSVVGTVPSITVPGITASLQVTSGELYLVVTAVIPPTPHLTGIHLNGPTLAISATNGADNGSFVLLESTNVALPLMQWTPVLTNKFDGSGDLNLSTNIINPNNGQQFYLLSQ